MLELCSTQGHSSDETYYKQIILVRARVGGKSVVEIVGKTRIDDNYNHVIRIERLHRHIMVRINRKLYLPVLELEPENFRYIALFQLFVDESVEGEIDIPVRFDHPLFAEQVIVGSAERANPQAFTTSKPYKGMFAQLC